MHMPKLVFLCETKLTPRKMQERSQKLNFENCFQVDRTGKGGLGLNVGFGLEGGCKVLV